MDTKVCKHCGTKKDLSLFPKDKALKDGYKNHCKACNAKISDAYRKRHPERVKEQVKRYHAKPAVKEALKVYNRSDRRKEIERRHRETEKRKKYLEEYTQTDKYKERARRYAKTEKGRASLQKNVKIWIGKNPHKYKAHTEVNKAILRGDLTRLPCSICGSENSQAHHEDYSKPLEVIFFCSKHHAERHKELRKMRLVRETKS